VKSLDESGSLIDETHTFYTTHNAIMVGGQFPWLTSLAFSVRLVDEGARGPGGGSKAMVRSKTVRELKDALAASQHLPSINTIAVDSSGETLYGVLGPFANFTDEQLVDCQFNGPTYFGNSAACEWNTDPDSAADGLMGASKLVNQFRNDYVTNSNSSYWLTNPEEPLTGWPLVLGDIETERSPRTRSGLAMVAQRQAGTDGLPGTTFDMDNMQELMLSNQNYVGQILRDDLVTLCTDNPTVTVDGAEINLATACQVLADWDLTSNLDSRGAHLFREFMRAARVDESSRSRSMPAALNYVTDFGLEDPVNTPRGLDTTDNALALEFLGRAVIAINAAGIALDAPLGELQGITLNDEYIPMPGGEEFEGVFNKMGYSAISAEGYPNPTGSGASWLMIAIPDGENTQARGIAALSQSTDPTSPHYSDMTQLFSQGQMVDLPFTQAAVEAAALSTLEIGEGTGECDDDGWQNFSHLGAEDESSCRQIFNDIADAQLTDYVD
jgi:acyl-homoserine-lactone acylase